jgi:hypothetical protein
MSLITDELVRIVRTAIPCCRNASASRAENVLSSYCLCLVVAWAVLRALVSIARSGRSGRPAHSRGIVTILITTHDDLALHRQIVHDILDLLEAESFFLKPSKCKFERSSIEYLGIVISNGAISIDPTK